MWQLWSLAPEDGTRTELIHEYTLDEEVAATRALIWLHNLDRTSHTNRALTLINTSPQQETALQLQH